MRDNLSNTGRGGHRARSSRSVSVAKWLTVPVGMLVSSLLVWQASNAAFSADTSNPGNQWASGDVVLSDDDNTNTAMFNAGNLKPGDKDANCLTVTYSGSLDASVKLYASATGALAPYLTLTVEQGTGGGYGSCTNFVPDASPVYNGTLSGFAAAHVNFSNGWGSFTPTGGAPSDLKTYRITYELQDNDDAQAKTANATFTWEAQNTTP